MADKTDTTEQFIMGTIAAACLPLLPLGVSFLIYMLATVGGIMSWLIVVAFVLVMIWGMPIVWDVFKICWFGHE